MSKAQCGTSCHQPEDAGSTPLFPEARSALTYLLLQDGPHLSLSLSAASPPEVGSVQLSRGPAPQSWGAAVPLELRQLEEQWPHHDRRPPQAAASCSLTGVLLRSPY